MNEEKDIQNERKKIRLLFLTVIIVLIVQYMLVGIVGHYKSEPWPAFVLPGFKAVYHDGSTVRLIAHEFYVTWQQEPFYETKIKNDQLFRGIPTSMRRGVIVKDFKRWSEIKEGDEEFKQWLRGRLSHIHPDRIPVEMRMLKKQKNYLQSDDDLVLTDELTLEDHRIRF